MNVSKFEDLERLGKMLDEGKIDRDEYERLKADLLAEGEPSTPADPMEGKPAGWYNDPSGKAQHQAYWDGEKWTDQTRTQFQAKVSQAQVAPKSDKKWYQRIGVWLLIALAVLFILAQLNGGGSGGGEDAVEHDAVGAYVVCQQFVEDRLTSPASAEYGDTYSRATTHLGGGRYRVETYVDSENAFGATLRSDFTCVVSHVSGDRYRLESLDFEE